MSFLRRFASSVTVLHEGRILSEGTVEQVQSDERVREVYLGRSRDERSGAHLGDRSPGGATTTEEVDA
jgi:urea transport system ATP-binding protein